jgi:hypothetical protein
MKYSYSKAMAVLHKIVKLVKNGVLMIIHDNIYKLLEKLGDELRFVFITSYARIHPISKKNDACVEAGAGVFIKVTQSESEKCVFMQRSPLCIFSFFAIARNIFHATTTKFRVLVITTNVFTEKNDSIFLQEWYQVLDVSYSNKAIDTARAINPFIRKQMEQMRHDKIIGCF